MKDKFCFPSPSLLALLPTEHFAFQYVDGVNVDHTQVANIAKMQLPVSLSDVFALENDPWM